jgi:hypothetical protein
MTRIFAKAAILICLGFSVSSPVHSGQKRNLASDNGCFPWQEFRNGQCVSKPTQTTPPPLPEQPTAAASPAVAAPAPPSPPSPAVAPAPPAPAPPSLVASPPPEKRTRAPQLPIVCDGGIVNDGACTCPSGFRLMAASGDAGGGGTCVRTNAENCLGGELTAGGQCICNGQVTMDGETYLLEYSNGKCLPMRCPVTAMSGRQCVSTSSTEPKPEAEPRGRPASRDNRQTRDESDAGHQCRHGMVMTRAGCVPVRRRLPDVFRQYYRYY